MVSTRYEINLRKPEEHTVVYLVNKPLSLGAYRFDSIAWLVYPISIGARSLLGGELPLFGEELPIVSASSDKGI